MGALLRAGVERAATRRFVLTLDRIGAFPHLRRPRVVWLGPSVASAAFAGLATAIRSAYATAGFRFEHDEALPHVTLARIGRGQRPPPSALSAIAVPPFPAPVDAVTLFESLPAGPTTRYVALERVALSGPEATASDAAG